MKLQTFTFLFLLMQHKKMISHILTEVPDVPHGVDVGVPFVENDEERRSGDALCQCFTVQIVPEEANTVLAQRQQLELECIHLH